jgi:acetylornithine deacetylase/succinyl-diaminopimelate desuccinylase-like protein
LTPERASESETVRLLRDLLRIDTSNPPGRETLAAECIQRFLDSRGVECHLVGPDPGRLNLVAQVHAEGPSVAFVGHLDVVPADAAGWSVDPFGGVEADGFLWGRGAVDMKCAAAAWCGALAELAAHPRGCSATVVLAADEEDGAAGVGMPWLLQERPDLIRTDYAIGEGAGERFEVDGEPVYLFSVGEKQPARVKIAWQGRPGDASMPSVGANALERLVRVLERLSSHRFDRKAVPELAELERLVAAAAHVDPALVRLLETVDRTVVMPTDVEAPGKENVIPDEVIVPLRCHVHVGTTPDELEAEIAAALGDGPWDISVEPGEEGSVAPAASPLRAAVARAVETEEPGARAVPTLGTGHTDLAPLRNELGTVAYGFLPFRHTSAASNQETKHGLDERVDVRDVLVQQRAAVEIVDALADGST